MKTEIRSSTNSLRSRTSKGVGRLQRGMSMIELSLVLIVLAIVLASVYWGFSQNQRRVEIAENVQVITEIVGNLQGKFGKTNTYSDITTPVAVKSEVIPGILKVSANAAQNSYGGDIEIDPAKCVSTTAFDCATLKWPKVPKAQCAELVIGASRGARRVTVGGTPVKPLDQALIVSTLAEKCDDADASDIVFTIGRGA